MTLFFKYAWFFKWMINLWPPLFFSRIKVIYLSADFREARVRLSLSYWNKNAVGTQFGGSLFSMTDPFYMLMLMARLGKDYIIWDKSAEIEFIKPGRTSVFADFIITDELLNNIFNRTADGSKYLPKIDVYIKDKNNELVAKVTRELYIRRKKNQ